MRTHPGRSDRANAVPGPYRLTDLVREDRVKPSLAATTRDGAIAELIDLLVASGDLPSRDRDAAIAAVITRESTMTTGVGYGVALPHAAVGAVGEVVAAVGLTPSGLDFNAVDRLPVTLIILLLVPENRFQTHVRTLAGIARILNDSRLRESLKRSASAAEVCSLIRRSEGVAG